MKKPRPLFLGVLLRVHDRPLTTKIVLNELRAYDHLAPERLKVRVVVWADRPTPAVKNVVDSFSDIVDDVAYAKYPMLDRRGEHFLQCQNDHLDLAERVWGEEPDWIYVSDDDQWFEPRRAYERLIPALERPEVDGYIVGCLFFQTGMFEGIEDGATDTYNINRHHNSIVLYRHVPGARFSGTRMLKCPDDVLDQIVIQNRERFLEIPNLEYGGWRYVERVRIRERYREAGKINDTFVESLLKPDLRVFPNQFDSTYGPWLDRMKEALHA